MLFGADQIGRDMLTRMMYGSRMTIGVAIMLRFSKIREVV
jgi:ABC-type dipeptide/oligopeptide/nickel transport system permease subunit